MNKEVGVTQTWPDGIIAQLDQADHLAHALADSLTIEHLLVFNHLYIAAISRALDKQSPSPVREVEAGRISAWFMRTYVEPGRIPDECVPHAKSSLGTN